MLGRLWQLVNFTLSTGLREPASTGSGQPPILAAMPLIACHPTPFDPQVFELEAQPAPLAYVGGDRSSVAP
jgi:hypothetical protein